MTQLVHDTIDLTGAAAPALLQADAPVLSEDAPDSFYLVGLIGGKEVGKSALVNALVGQNISDETSFGPGTETVVAYTHRSVEGALRKLLEREAPGEHRLVLHDVDSLQRQVLLDLPDIDSRWRAHVQLTRRMLRQMLYPLWITSVEKYADRQVQEMLRAVAEGNSPANFLFCLNKADQLNAKDAEELRQDFSLRIARLLSIDAPHVRLISAHQPQRFDLPELREKLSRQQPNHAVDDSHQAARRQQWNTLLNWVDRQGVQEQAERLQRMYDQARDHLAERLGAGLLEQAVPGILGDAGHRLALVNEVLDQRMARWPVVNVLHTLLSPLALLVQKNIGRAQSSDARALVQAHLDVNARPLASLLQGAFAQLQQTQPALGAMYARRKLWEALPAESAVQDLLEQLADGVTRQRQSIRDHFQSRWALLFAPLRWLLTIGALLWFPFVQPLLEASLQKNLSTTTRDLVLLGVQMLGVSYLLKQLIFLGGYFLLLWLLLRWHTQRRVSGFVKRWEKQDEPDSPANLVTRIIGWLDGLVEPIAVARDRAQSLVERIEKARKAV